MSKQTEDIKTPDPQAFLTEYEALCSKHGLRLAPVILPVDVMGKSVLTLDLGLQQYTPTNM